MAGYVATGQIDAARDIAFDARKQHPQDSRIAALEGIIAYTDGDYDRSEAILRSVIEANPDNPVAGINLAIVLGKKGSGTEAREILTGISSRYGGTPLAKRAQAILADLKE
jgi:Flp pilus assembly protein TadD